jgi:hypothetical protein
MYYIYHIPGIKIGCTTNPKRRILEVQKFTKYEILETHSDINIASEREIQLQKQYGYKIDATPYSQSYKWATSGNPSVEPMLDAAKKWKEANPEKHKEIARLGGLKQGKIQGKKNAESGMFSALGKKMSEYNNRIQTCIHCGKTTRGIGYIRWHGDKCKNKIVK